VTWPNGADLDPTWMYDELKMAETWSVPNGTNLSASAM